MSTFVIPHCSSSIQGCLVLKWSFSLHSPPPPQIVLIALWLILDLCKLSWTITLPDVTAHVVILFEPQQYIQILPASLWILMYPLCYFFNLFTFSAVNLKIFLIRCLKCFFRKKQDRLTKSFGDAGIYFLLLTNNKWLLMFYDFA